MMAHQFKQPQPLCELNPDVPGALVDVIDRLMQKAPEARFAATSDVVESLRPLAASDAAPVPSIKPAAPARPAAAASSPRAVAPSAPTPKPPALGVLPTRNSLRSAHQPAAASAAEPKARPEPKAKAEPKARPEPEARPQPPPERVIPGGSSEQSPMAWDQRLGPIGIGISALVACGLVYAVAVWLQLF